MLFVVDPGRFVTQTARALADGDVECLALRVVALANDNDQATRTKADTDWDMHCRP